MFTVGCLGQMRQIARRKTKRKKKKNWRKKILPGETANRLFTIPVDFSGKEVGHVLLVQAMAENLTGTPRSAKKNNSLTAQLDEARWSAFVFFLCHKAAKASRKLERRIRSNGHRWRVTHFIARSYDSVKKKKKRSIKFTVTMISYFAMSGKSRAKNPKKYGVITSV